MTGIPGYNKKRKSAPDIRAALCDVCGAPAAIFYADGQKKCYVCVEAAWHSAVESGEKTDDEA